MAAFIVLAQASGAWRDLIRFSMSDEIPNVLAQRYASPAMRQVWSPTGKIRLERELWLAVLRAQRDLGLKVPDGVLAAYEGVIDQIDLADIDQRERVTRHDVKARLEAFCDLAGHQHLHKGMTSRDLTENVEQLQVHRSLQQVIVKCVACLKALAERAEETRHIILTARTHNVAAQPTTLGKRLAMFGGEWLVALSQAQNLAENYPARGLKGAVGTQLDMLTLFGGRTADVDALESAVFSHLGLPTHFTNVGQVYPRSLDLSVVSALTTLGSAPANFAKTLRLMAGHGFASEGFAPGQTGSSAMPHKVNARSCERIDGFETLLKGYLAMAAGLAGQQWNEGDVSCSVVRRVMLPDAFFAIDGLLETTLVVLAQMEVFPKRIEAELLDTLPFLATTTLLMEAVKGGAGRETAHAAIKEHALAAAREIQQGAAHNSLPARLANDGRIGLSVEAIDNVLKDARDLTGRADAQVDHFKSEVARWRARFPASETIRAGSIL